VLRIIHLDIHVSDNISDTGIVSLRSKYMDPKKFINCWVPSLLTYGCNCSIMLVISSNISCSPWKWPCRAEACSRVQYTGLCKIYFEYCDGILINKYMVMKQQCKTLKFYLNKSSVFLFSVCFEDCSVEQLTYPWTTVQFLINSKFCSRFQASAVV
jgi:hypothetical protein